MEGVPGVNHTVPNPNHYDKSIVLDVKPLRSLKPVFPNGNQGPPFVGCPPFGPSSSEYSPFYPFGAQQPTQDTPDLNQTQDTPPPSYVPPLRSYRTPTESNGPSSSSATKRGVGRPKGSGNVKKKEKQTAAKETNLDVQVVKRFTADFDSGISAAEREDGNGYLVSSVLTRFDAVRRRLSQVDYAKAATSKAAGILMSNGVRTNMKKRVGTVPGIEVGDIFFSRIEMCLVGLHMQTMAGIDYITSKVGSGEEPLATSIVSAGRYDGDAQDPESLIYSGQGGNADKNGQASDQKLERGNLALETSLRKGNGVRVIRGEEDAATKTGKIYIYDGLYSISESWVEKGKSGCNTFKYKLVRLPGQPPAFGVWKSVQKWREGLTTRPGLILPDLTSGVESKPVSLVNDVDEERGPAYFTYISSLKYSESFKLTPPAIGCSCSGSCSPGDLNCSCIRKNGGDLPYLNGVMLVSRRPMIYECGPTCPCHANCKNKVIQTGLKSFLEVFKTENRGWGLRSWDSIRAGSFICEHAGEVKDIGRLRVYQDEDEYVFDTSRVYNSFKWNYEPALVDEDPSDEVPEEFDLPSPVLISAKKFGNVARFMNHSCSPNVFWQPIVCEGNGESVIHIAFFAMRHIPPMAELTYDYGVSEARDGSFLQGKRKCLCGSEQCRGSFG
ncbi:PREDICTED: histone-lysine N-methyltransferase, H3 lysine-9 specific SUVH3 [Camelina sativa]|uniref:Histone-lysine N-methyltransferase, H3 lysine-9 specific SUVH3 n=1 Tax=Camelina sativa TaxID=90675 RepID=A0ABM0WI06_CAMSA|nr:PREDICTED: histone-lysine N-methyltransferase, H3 lysine-9 specific SUVH3 [Camelina sativa]